MLHAEKQEGLGDEVTCVTCTGYSQATKGHPNQFEVVYKLYAKNANTFKRLPSDNRDALEEITRQLFSKVRSVLFKSRAHPRMSRDFDSQALLLFSVQH